VASALAPELMAAGKPSRTRPLETDGWDDARLVEGCVGGNQDAWTSLVNRYRRLIYSIPLRYGATPEDAGDLFQAVCLELYAELPKLRKVESLKSWLMTVTAHQAFHWKRRRQRRALREVEPLEPDLEPASHALPSDILHATQREQALRDAVAALSPRCRDLIELLFFADPPLPYAEAARRLGLATGSIGFIRGRCLKKLQQELKDREFVP
jgi:RNA polymerase sigma factor (sigma-70 family)